MEKKRETNSLVYVLASAAPRKGWSKDSSLSRFMYALSVLSSMGSVAEPDTATVTAENLALQRFSAGLFTLSRPRCSVEEVQSASELMLTVLNLRARLVDFVSHPVPMYCQQAWRA